MAKTVECWGCECGVPLRGEMHEEETDIPGTIYAYPCRRATEKQEGGDGRQWAEVPR